MKALYHLLIALVLLSLCHTGEAMTTPPPHLGPLVQAFDIATGQCNGITPGTPGAIKRAADQTCHEAFVQLDMAGMNEGCSGWEKAKCRRVLGEPIFECTIKFPTCVLAELYQTPRTFLSCARVALAEFLIRRHQLHRTSGSGYAGGSGSGYAGGSGSGYASGSGSGYASGSSSGYGYAGGSGSGYASGSGSGYGYTGGSGSGYDYAGSGAAAVSPSHFEIPSLPPTPENPSAPVNPALLHDPSFGVESFLSQYPTQGSGSSPPYPSSPRHPSSPRYPSSSRHPSPPGYPPVPPYSAHGGSSFLDSSLPPTPQHYSAPVNPFLVRDEGFSVDDVPYGTPQPFHGSDSLPPTPRHYSGPVDPSLVQDEEFGVDDLPYDEPYDENQPEQTGSGEDEGSAGQKQTRHPCTEPGCKSSFKHRYTLQRHLKHHKMAREGQLNCRVPDCGKSFYSPSSLLRHLEEKHPAPGEEPGGRPRKGRGKDKRKGSSSQAGSDGGEDGGTYECKEPGCDKSYDSEIKLQRHMKYHNLKKQGHTCSQCGQGFSSKQRLQYHQESTGHVQVQAPKPPKPYPCTHEGCTKSYGSASRLRAHMKTHEG